MYPVNVFHWSSFVSTWVWRNNAVPQCYINTTFTTNGWTIQTGGTVFFCGFLKSFWLVLRSYLLVKKENELFLYDKWAKRGLKFLNATFSLVTFATNFDAFCLLRPYCDISMVFISLTVSEINSTKNGPNFEILHNWE